MKLIGSIFVNMSHKLENAMEAIFDQPHSLTVQTQAVFLQIAASILVLPIAILALAFSPFNYLASFFFFVMASAFIFGLRLKLMSDLLQTGSPYAGKLPKFEEPFQLWKKGLGFMTVFLIYGAIIGLISGLPLYLTSLLIEVCSKEGVFISEIAAFTLIAMAMFCLVLKIMLSPITELAISNYAGSGNLARAIFNVKESISPIFRKPGSVIATMLLDIGISIAQFCAVGFYVIVLAFATPVCIVLFPLLIFLIPMYIAVVPLYFALGNACDFIHSHIWAQTLLECNWNNAAQEGSQAPSNCCTSQSPEVEQFDNDENKTT